MRLSKHRRSTMAEMNMTPMIDIVFLLIIFFMTVSQISAVNRERVELPKLDGSEEQKPAVLTINVTEPGDIMVAGDRLSLSRLIALVSDELTRLGGDASRLTVIVRADQRGRSQTVNEIVSALSRLQITRIRIAVEVPQ